jgi:hypothetical protein
MKVSRYGGATGEELMVRACMSCRLEERASAGERMEMRDGGSVKRPRTPGMRKRKEKSMRYKDVNLGFWRGAAELVTTSGPDGEAVTPLAVELPTVTVTADVCPADTDAIGAPDDELGQIVVVTPLTIVIIVDDGAMPNIINEVELLPGRVEADIAALDTIVEVELLQYRVDNDVATLNATVEVELLTERTDDDVAGEEEELVVVETQPRMLELEIVGPPPPRPPIMP